MRRIDQLINGRFEYALPEILLSTSQIDIQTKENKNYRSDFHINSSTDKKLKGYVFSSNKRINCSIFDFSDVQVQVIYEVDVTGMVEGDTLAGEFTICSDAGECKLPFSVKILGDYAHSYKGEVRSLADFEKVAYGDMLETYRVFVAPGFREVFTGADEQYLSLYKGLSKLPVSFHDIEEFMIGAGLKEQVKLTIPSLYKELHELKNTSKETIQIIKNEWGYLQIDVTVSAPFIDIEKSEITASDFIGSVYNFDYIIKKERLHGGKNYGKIVFSTCYETFTYEVVVEKSQKVLKLKRNYNLRKYIIQLVDLYIDFRTNRLNVKDWVEKSEKVIESIVKLGELYRYYRLFLAQLYFADNRTEEGEEILKEFDGVKKLLFNPELKAYFLYLSTLNKEDKKHIQSANDKVYSLYLQNQDKWQLLWIRLYMDDDLIRNLARRLEAIEYQFRLGCRSRIIYLEAYDIITKEPTRLKRLSEFEIQLLRWAAKQKLLEQEISLQAAGIASRSKVYDKGIFQILECCYEEFAQKEVLSAMCSMLIKGNKIGQEHFRWYELAVLQGLRITRLYEYYIDSMDEEYRPILPQMIRMYFTYNNTLSHKKKAAVYANVIHNKLEDKITYRNYKDAMEQFMMEQLAAGNISSNLMIIYKDFLHKAQLTKRMLETWNKVQFTYEVKCSNPRVHSITVIHHQLETPQVVPFIEGKAYVQIYSDEYAIILQDDMRKEYVKTIPYSFDKLVPDLGGLKDSLDLSSEDPGFLIYMCEKGSEAGVISIENVTYYQKLLNAPQVNTQYKTASRKKLIQFYHSHTEIEHLDEFLHSIDYNEFVKTERVLFIELLIQRFKYHDAYRMIQIYGYEGISYDNLIRLCSRMILLKEYELIEELLEFCHYVFTTGKYDETVLVYLVDYYEGPAQEMYDIWSAAKDFDMVTMRLEEKVLSLLMFSRTYMPDGYKVFDSYYMHKGNKKVIAAYLIFEAYGYFIKGIDLSDMIFKYLEELIEQNEELDDVCSLALLKYYSNMDELPERQLIIASGLLEKYSYRGLRFSFYKKFDEALIRPYHIADKIFVEYGTNPASKVILHYYIEEAQSRQELSAGDLASAFDVNDENSKKAAKIDLQAEINYIYKAEPMKNLYEGIFSKEFTLFYGQTLHYYIEEELGGAIKEFSKNKVTVESSIEAACNSKYDLINHMIAKYHNKEDEELFESMEEYLTDNYLVDKMFTLM